MRNLDGNTITEAVRERVRHTPDPRLRSIGDALVRHLHAFVREIEPTQAEWSGAIEFLTRTGHMCDAHRQEFILLSDVLGVSMLVDAINHPLPGGATETTVLGPFHVEDAPERPLGADISPGYPGMPLFITGSVRSTDGRPLVDATLDVWHSDGDGYYDVQRMDDAHGLTMRARLRAGSGGGFHFRTIMPAAYPIPSDGPVGDMLAAQGRHPYRPAHVHFMIRSPGHEPLVTHLFVAGDPYLDSDVVFGVKDSLVLDFAEKPAGLAPDGTEIGESHRHLHYDFVLAPLGDLREASTPTLQTSND